VAGFDTVEKVAHTDKKELADAVPDLSIANAEDIINQAACVLDKIESGDLSPEGWSKSETQGKPIRIVKFDSMPQPVEKPTRIDLLGVGQCTYCSGTLVENRGEVICRECGKREQTDSSANDDWEDRARRLRRELRR